jgi:hypothetical protein
MLPTILLGSLGELVKMLQRRGVSKEGNRLLRWALVIASTQAVRRVWNEDSDYLAVLRQTILRGGELADRHGPPSGGLAGPFR